MKVEILKIEANEELINNTNDVKALEGDESDGSLGLTEELVNSKDDVKSAEEAVSNSAWGLNNAMGIMAGVAQVAAGVIVMPAFPPLGAGLINSGANGVTYSLATNNDEMEVGVYAKRMAINATVGTVTGGVGSWLSSSTLILKSLGQGAAPVVGYAASGAVGQVAGGMAEGAVEWKKPEIPARRVVVGIIAGGVGGAIVRNFSAGVSSSSAKASSDFIKTVAEGSAAGSAVAVVAQATDNAMNGKEITQNLGQAALQGAVAGVVLNSVDKLQQNSQSTHSNSQGIQPPIKVTQAKLLPSTQAAIHREKDKKKNEQKDEERGDQSLSLKNISNSKR